MISNTLMKELLTELCSCKDTVFSQSEKERYRIHERKTENGHAFFCIEAVTLSKNPLAVSHEELCWLEWKINELYIAHTSDKCELIRRGLAVVELWVEQMKSEFPHVQFDISLSIACQDADVPPSATLRFWSVRNGIHCIEPTEAEQEKFEQPVLIKQVNV